MSRCTKLLEKARESPTNITVSELRRLAECYGFILARTRGSHFNYKVPFRKQTLSLQDGRDGKAKRYQVQQVLELIAENEDRTGDHARD